MLMYGRNQINIAQQLCFRKKNIARWSAKYEKEISRRDLSSTPCTSGSRLPTIITPPTSIRRLPPASGPSPGSGPPPASGLSPASGPPPESDPSPASDVPAPSSGPSYSIRSSPSIRPFPSIRRGSPTCWTLLSTLRQPQSSRTIALAGGASLGITCGTTIAAGVCFRPRRGKEEALVPEAAVGVGTFQSSASSPRGLCSPALSRGHSRAPGLCPSRFTVSSISQAQVLS